ncbi:MAG: adenylyltransferase/cytidyltransferase family protein [Paracoccaceae bacterium]
MNQNLALKSLQELVSCLNKNFGGKYFIIDGTLLGLVRDGGFITGDHDIDIGMWVEDYDITIIDDFIAAGFKYERKFGTPSTGLELRFRYGDIPIDLIFFHRETDHIWNNLYTAQGQTLKAVSPIFSLEPANFLGLNVMVPSPPKKYIETVYGSKWQHPVKIWNYKYCQQNIKPVGSIFWKMAYPLKKAYWHFRQGSIYQSASPATKKIIFTDGAFDLFHANHVALLEEAKSLGDRLVVGVLSDECVANYKRLPVIPQDERLRIVQSQSCVDEAFILNAPMDAKTMREIINTYNITTIVYAGNSTPEFYQEIEEMGLLIRPIYRTGTNTSAIISRIIDRNVLPNNIAN